MAPALVQSCKATSSAASNSINKAFGSNVVAGNRILVYAVSAGSSAPLQAPTGGGITFTQLATNQVGTANPQLALYSGVVVSSAALTVTVTVATGGPELGFTAEEWSGLDGSAGTGCIDVQATGGVNTASTATCASGTTAATHAAGQLAVTAVGDWGSSATWTLSTANGFTKNSAASLDADANTGIGVANKISSNGVTEGAAVWSNGAISANDCAWVVVIKAAAAAAAGLPDVTMAPIGGY